MTSLTSSGRDGPLAVRTIKRPGDGEDIDPEKRSPEASSTSSCLVLVRLTTSAHTIEIVPANRWCYRMQCFYTARELAQRLGLDVGTWTVTFQSRLGRTPWIRPYTDVVIPELAGKGVKRLAVFCPAFVADCLETLEEIGIRAKEQFLGAGGEALTLVPSLNTHPSWVRGLTRMLRELRGEDVEPGAAA